MLRKMPLATDVMLDASNLVFHPDDLPVVLSMALHNCKDEDLRDAFSACLDILGRQQTK
jgi:hypothetical protein